MAGAADVQMHFRSTSDQFRAKIGRFRERMRYRYLPKFVDLLVDLSTRPAVKKVKSQVPFGILIDNTILGHAVTHETAWISTGPKEWAGKPVNTGYAARVPVYSSSSDPRVYEDVQYFPGIVNLARVGALKLLTSAELIEERDRQPAGRFIGYSYYDYSMLNDAKIESVDGHILLARTSYSRRPDFAAEQRSRITNYDDQIYLKILNTLGEKNSQDAWHIRTSEINNLFCFLTMDYKLIASIKRNSSEASIKSLNTKVMRPSDFGKHFGLRPFEPHLFSYHGASYPVRSDISMPDGKRRPKKFYGGGKK